MDKDEILVGLVGLAAIGGFVFIYLQLKNTNAAIVSVASQQSNKAQAAPATYYQSAALPSSTAADYGSTSTTGSSDDVATTAADSLQASEAATNASLSANLASIQAATQTSLSSIQANANTANQAGATGFIGNTLSQFLNDRDANNNPGAAQSIYGYVDTPQGNYTTSFIYSGVGSDPTLYTDPTLNYSLYNPSYNSSAPPVPGSTAASNAVH